MPLRGILGSDLLNHRPDWQVMDNPFAADDREPDPIVLLPAIKPDLALFHAPLADRSGNIWIGVRRELMTMAHAAAGTLVTVEQVTDDNLLDDPRTAAGTIPALYLTALAEAPAGAWPLGLFGCYGADRDHLATYVEAARSAEGFSRYLQDHVLDREAAE